MVFLWFSHGFPTPGEFVRAPDLRGLPGRRAEILRAAPQARDAEPQGRAERPAAGVSQ